LCTAEALTKTDGRDEGQDREVRVRRVRHAKTGGLEAAHEIGFAVTADLRRQHRMVPLERFQRGHVDDHRTARLEHAVHLGDRRALDGIGQRIENVERRHESEPRVRKRQLRHGGARDRFGAVLPGVLKSGPCEVDTVCGAVSAEHREVVPGAAAAVENAGAASGCGTRDEWFDESAEAAEPEMVALRARGGLEETIHRDKLVANSYIFRS